MSGINMKPLEGNQTTFANNISNSLRGKKVLVTGIISPRLIYLVCLSALLKRAEVGFHGLLNVWHLIVLSSVDARARPYKNSQNR